jgi:hypothetical protein
MTGFSNWWRRGFSKSAIIAVFILCALPTGILVALITPPGQSPDEQAHLARAAGLLHGAVLGTRKMFTDPDNGKPEWRTGVKVDAGLENAPWGVTTAIAGRPVVTSQDFLTTDAIASNHNYVFPNIPNTVSYFPAAYLPATFALAVGLALHASPHTCFMLARLAMLAAFLLLGALTLWLAAWGEALLLTILLLPMTLFLAGTVNEDGMLTAMACLACAALTRNSRKGWLLGLLVFVLFLGAKPPYLPMLGAFLLPLFGPGFWRRVRDVAIACVPVLIWVALISAFVILPSKTLMYHPGVLYTGDRSVWLDHADPAANLHTLAAQPERFITLPWHTLKISAFLLLHEMIGVLGLLQIPLPDPYYRLWLLSGLVSLAGLVFSNRPIQVPPGTAAVNLVSVGFLLAVTSWLIMITLYLDWSNVGLDSIAGLQGRYFLPLLPFLLLGIPGLRGRFYVPPLLAALPTIALGLYDMGYLPMKLIWNYYLY